MHTDFCYLILLLVAQKDPTMYNGIRDRFSRFSVLGISRDDFDVHEPDLGLGDLLVLFCRNVNKAQRLDDTPTLIRSHKA